MNRVEFRIEQVPLNRDGSPTLRLVERLAELGRQGWHVASADLTPHPSDREGRVTVLLERELDNDVRPSKSGSARRASARGAEATLRASQHLVEADDSSAGRAIPGCETQAKRSELSKPHGRD